MITPWQTLKQTLTLFALLGGFVACAGNQVLENQKSEATFSKATSDAGQQVQTIEAEMERHKQVWANANKHPPANWNSLKGLAKVQMTSAQVALRQLKGNYHRLHLASGEFSAYAHSHPRVRSIDKGWSQAADWHQTLTHSIQDFNQQLAKTSLLLNNLTQLWSTNGLYKKRNSADLAASLQRDTETWRVTYQELTNNFNQGQTHFNAWQTRRPSHWSATVENALFPLQVMHKSLDEVQRLIQGLDKLKEDYFTYFDGRSEVTTLDADWNQWEQFHSSREKLVAQLTSATARCHKSFDQLNQILQESAVTTTSPAAVDEDQKQSPQ
ncbi:MAG: hypothetical protein AB7N80_13790 [Bdellovibrionales bacterium]